MRRRPRAEVLPWHPPWSGGAPLPHLLTNGLRTFLTYYLQEQGPVGGTESIAIVTFHGCLASRLGPPNDETLHGHPLYGRGLQFYAAHVIHDSPLLADLLTINRVHRQHRDEDWAAYRHLLLAFHDEVFECIAVSYDVETVTAPLPDVLADVARRLTASY